MVPDWKREMREEVAAAASNPDILRVSQWIGEAEKDLPDPKQQLGFASCPFEFRTLGSKLLRALSERIKQAKLPSLRFKQNLSALRELDKFKGRRERMLAEAGYK